MGSDKTWSDNEQAVLCHAWREVSQDASTGNSQKAEAFWTRIANRVNRGSTDRGLLAGVISRTPSLQRYLHSLASIGGYVFHSH